MAVGEFLTSRYYASSSFKVKIEKKTRARIQPLRTKTRYARAHVYRYLSYAAYVSFADVGRICCAWRTKTRPFFPLGISSFATGAPSKEKRRRKKKGVQRALCVTKSGRADAYLRAQPNFPGYVTACRVHVGSC